MKKNKKDLTIEFIPAYECFCVDKIDPNAVKYEWQCAGLVIRHIREHVGMEQDIFASLLQGYTRTQISRYETEKTEPPVDFWIKLVKFFGLNITWVFTGKDKPYTLEYQESEERQRLEKWITLLDDKADFIKELRGL